MNTTNFTHDTYLDTLAADLTRRGWQKSALVVLEAGRPLCYLFGQLLWVAQPTLSLLWSTTSIRQMAHLLEDPEAVTGLIKRLNQQD